jgi:hypothetical protein
MSPLEIKRFDIRKREWYRVASLKPGDKPIFMEDLTNEGIAEQYRFTCALEDTHTLVEKNVGGIIDRGLGVKIRNPNGAWQEVRRVNKRQEFVLKMTNATFKIVHR